MACKGSRKPKQVAINSNLPQEIVSYIFRFLLPVEIRSASIVCHMWAKASEDPLLWRHIRFELFTKSEAFPDVLLDSLKRRCVQHLSFQHTSTPMQIIQACKYFAGNLKSLHLDGCRCVSEKILGIIFKTCPNLKQLNLRRCRQLDVTKKSSWLEKHIDVLKGVTSLDISCCKGLGDWAIINIPTLFSALENLCISGCKEVSLSSWLELGKKLTSLRALDISRSDMSDDILLKFSEIQSLHLTSINVSACKQLTDNGIVSLVKNQHGLQCLKLSCLDITNTSMIAIGKYLMDLRILDLNSCRQITDVVLQQCRSLLRTLTSLNLYSCYQLSSSGMQGFFCKSQENSSTVKSVLPLNTLVLNGCSLATDTMIDRCSKVLSNLQELDISSCLHVTDIGIQAITTSLLLLKVFKVSWCANVTDAGLLGTAGHTNDTSNQFDCNSTNYERICKQQNDKWSSKDCKVVACSSGVSRLIDLCVFDVSHCTSVTDDGLAAVYQLRSLTSLNINMCVEISDVTLHGLANHARGLQSLSLSGCNLVTDSGLIAVAQNLVRLRSLDVSKCDHITDLGVLNLAKNCKDLTHLDLSMCCQVTSHSVDELEANLPGLVSIQLRHSGAKSSYKYL